jgi:hypothetical protein
MVTLHQGDASPSSLSIRRRSRGGRSWLLSTLKEAYLALRFAQLRSHFHDESRSSERRRRDA